MVPTINKMVALFDNYEIDASKREIVTPIEQREENDFINALLKTSIIDVTMQFLHEKGHSNHWESFVSINCLKFKVIQNRNRIN